MLAILPCMMLGAMLIGLSVTSAIKVYLSHKALSDRTTHASKSYKVWSHKVRPTLTNEQLSAIYK